MVAKLVGCHVGAMWDPLNGKRLSRKPIKKKNPRKTMERDKEKR